MQLYGGQSGSSERSQTAGEPHVEPSGPRGGSLASFLRESPRPKRGAPSGERTHQHLEKGGRRDGETAENLRAKKEAQGQVDAINGKIKQAERSMRALFSNPPEDKEIRKILDKWNAAEKSPTLEKFRKLPDVHESLEKLGVTNLKEFNRLRKEGQSLEKDLSSAEKDLRALGGDPHSSEALSQPTQDQPGVQHGGTSELHGDSRSASIRTKSPGPERSVASSGRDLERDTHQGSLGRRKQIETRVGEIKQSMTALFREPIPPGKMQEILDHLHQRDKARKAKRSFEPGTDGHKRESARQSEHYENARLLLSEYGMHNMAEFENSRRELEKAEEDLDALHKASNHIERIQEKIRKKEKDIGKREMEKEKVKEGIVGIFKKNTDYKTIEEILDRLDRIDRIREINLGNDEALDRELKAQISEESYEVKVLLGSHITDEDFNSEGFDNLRKDYKDLKGKLNSDNEDLSELRGIRADLSGQRGSLRSFLRESPLREESEANEVAGRDVGVVGLKAYDTPDDKHNCAIYAVLGAIDYNMRTSEAKKVAEEIKLSLVIDDKVRGRGEMLELYNDGTGSAVDAFLKLREAGIVPEDRGISVYTNKYGVIKAIESNSGKEPICIRLDTDKKHFEALRPTSEGGDSV